MTIRHYLLGFDKATGALRQEWPIPPGCEPAVAHILRDNADRLAAIAPRELTPRRAERVGAAIRHRIDPGAYDYFVQAFDESSKVTARQPAAAE